MGAGTRVLIILYAAGIVALGMQPLSKDHKGLGSYVSKQSQELFGKSIDFSSFKMPSEISIEVGKPNGSKVQDVFKTSKADKQVEPFDKLSEKDREGLSGLLEKMTK